MSDELLEYVPPWYGERVRHLGEAHACAISPELEADAAYEKLWKQVIRVCRLDEGP